MEKSQADPHIFPTEIIVEILLRLPVQSLLRCRSVCKLWCSLISDPHFVKSHLTLSKTITTIDDLYSHDRYAHDRYAHHRLLFSTCPGIFSKTCNLSDFQYDNHNTVNSLEVHYPLGHSDSVPQIVGSCNGLICIVVDDDALFIWNPSTRKLKRIELSSGEFWYSSQYGFGYEESTDDYKVVEIARTLFENAVMVYSLRIGKWKKIGAFPIVKLLDCFGKFSNGALHWAAARKGSQYQSWCIISLDLAKESYGEVLQPAYDEDEGEKYLTVEVLREWLCVICDYLEIRRDLWVMKVYGVKDSWTKLASFPYMTDIGWCPSLVPLWIMEGGKILLHLGFDMVVYDTKNSSYLQIHILDQCLQTCTYVESLVSPHLVLETAASEVPMDVSEDKDHDPVDCGCSALQIGF